LRCALSRRAQHFPLPRYCEVELPDFFFAASSVLEPLVPLAPLEPLAPLVPLAPLADEAPLVDEDCVDEAPWFEVALEFTSVDCWFALTPLVTLWLPLPRFTPGLMLAPALTSALLIPTLALTPTFGFTLSVPDDPEVDDGVADEPLPEEAPLPLAELPGEPLLAPEPDDGEADEPPLDELPGV
jgi:hypothetical protein